MVFQEKNGTKAISRDVVPVKGIKVLFEAVDTTWSLSVELEDREFNVWLYPSNGDGYHPPGLILSRSDAKELALALLKELGNE